MNTPGKVEAGHSADVRIQLCLNGQVLPVAQLGPEYLILRTPVDHPPCDAEVVLTIDGVEKRWYVRLYEGIHVSKHKTLISPSVRSDLE